MKTKAIVLDCKKVLDDKINIRIAKGKLRSDSLLGNPVQIKIDRDELLKDRMQKQADLRTLEKDLEKMTHDHRG